MEKDKFIRFKAVEKILNDNSFYGLTVKRENNGRLLYRYASIKYHNVEIKVLTLKLDPTKVKSDKIVLGIKFNENEINGWKDFINAISFKQLYSLNKYGHFKGY